MVFLGEQPLKEVDGDERIEAKRRILRLSRRGRLSERLVTAPNVAGRTLSKAKPPFHERKTVGTPPSS